MIKQWTDKDMLEFARVASGGSYGDYKGCNSLTSKLKKYKLMNEDLNEHRQVRGIDSNLHDYDRIKETIQDNKFSLCHLGENIIELYKEYPNDTDLGKEVRKTILSWKEV
jgi:hypothetical protein